MSDQKNLFGGMARGGAMFSPCRNYRYTLTRTWSDAPPLVVIGLNPSTADERINDPTITRCIDFAKRWSHGGLVMLNLFAYRSTDPKILYKVEDAVGEMNDATLMDHHEHPLILAAWGAEKIARERARRVVTAFHVFGAKLHCLKLTKDGSPWHPLYVAADTKPVEYAP